MRADETVLNMDDEDQNEIFLLDTKIDNCVWRMLDICLKCEQFRVYPDESGKKCHVLCWADDYSRRITIGRFIRKGKYYSLDKRLVRFLTHPDSRHVKCPMLMERMMMAWNYEKGEGSDGRKD